MRHASRRLFARLIAPLLSFVTDKVVSRISTGGSFIETTGGVLGARDENE